MNIQLIIIIPIIYNIHFSPDKNISYLSITIIVGGNAYDLSLGITKNIKNLLPSFPYTFKVPIKENQG